MVDLEDMFSKFISSKPLFKDRSVLTISFSPEDIPHREKYIEDIGRMLAPALKGGRPSNLFIYGKCGTGKTVVCTHVAEELERIGKKTGQNIKVIYVNCKMGHLADTEYRLLAYLSKEFGKDLPFTGLPTDKIYQEFFNVIDKENQIIILIIDEIDTLVKKTGDEILYNLTRINQDLKKAKVSIIGITNDLGFIDKLDPRVKSSLSEEEILFPPYNAVQLQDILRQRAKNAFEIGVLEEGVIEKCSALAAQEHGDARKALDLLRVAGEIAERNGSEKIKIEHVDVAQDKIDKDRIIEMIRSQPKQSQAVLFSIVDLYDRGSEQKNVMNKRLTNVQTGEVFNKYNEICKKYRLTPLTQRRISDLIAEFDLFGVISTKIISRGRHGRTRAIELNLSNEMIERAKKVFGETFY